MAQFSRVEVINEILRIGVVPVFYHADFDVPKKVVDACAAAGLRVIEFTNRGDNAWRVFSDLVQHFVTADPDRDPGRRLGGRSRHWRAVYFERSKFHRWTRC